MNNSGRVSSVEWRDFKVKFMDIWHDVPGANDEEAYQTVISKLPPLYYDMGGGRAGEEEAPNPQNSHRTLSGRYPPRCSAHGAAVGGDKAQRDHGQGGGDVCY